MKRFILLFVFALVNIGIFAITDKQKDDLVFMYQEEKLAHDVYVTLGKEYGLKVFNNISNSEAKHMDEIKTLLTTYKIPVPSLKFGEFSDKGLQNLYNNLIKSGETSSKSAIKVALAIEDKDILDLKEKIKNAPTDIKIVYQNLLKGSENHKKAFNKF